MSNRSGEHRSENEKEKKSRSHSHHTHSSSGQKRPTESLSTGDESEVKRSKFDSDIPSHPNETAYHRSEHKHLRGGYDTNHGNRRNDSHSSKSRQRPRSRSRSREKRRNHDKYNSYNDRTKVSRRRSPIGSRFHHHERDNLKYNDRGNDRNLGSRVSTSVVELHKQLSSERRHQVSNKEEEDALSKNILPSNVEPQTKPVVPGPGTTKLVEEIEKRKLMFNKKDKNPECSSSVWEKTKFSQDSDGKMTAKFKRLMGIKDEDLSSAQPPQTSTAVKPDEHFADLEKQYEVARATTHTQRGVGFGFSLSRILSVKPKP